jgi:MSHA biogenesis protein MshI
MAGMRWFGKAKKKPGWLAFAMAADGLCAASVIRTAAKPLVLSVAHQVGKDELPLWEKLGKDVHAKLHHCTSLLPHGKYQLLSVEAPNVPEAELKTALRWKLKDMIDFPPIEATVDVLDIPLDPNAPVRVHNVFAAVARNQTIVGWQNRFAEAAIPLGVIDLPELAQRNLSALAEPEGRGLALLSFNHEGGLLTITYLGELILTRRIDVTLAQLQTTQVDQQTAAFDKITLELQRSLDHFDRQHHYIGLSKLLLAPLPEAGGSLHEYLAANLYTPVERMGLDAVLDLSLVPDLQDEVQQQRYFLVLGAALRDAVEAA